MMLAVASMPMNRHPWTAANPAHVHAVIVVARPRILLRRSACPPIVPDECGDIDRPMDANDLPPRWMRFLSGRPSADRQGLLEEIEARRRPDPKHRFRNFALPAWPAGPGSLRVDVARMLTGEGEDDEGPATFDLEDELHDVCQTFLDNARMQVSGPKVAETREMYDGIAHHLRATVALLRDLPEVSFMMLFVWGDLHRDSQLDRLPSDDPLRIVLSVRCGDMNEGQDALSRLAAIAEAAKLKLEAEAGGGGKGRLFDRLHGDPRLSLVLDAAKLVRRHRGAEAVTTGPNGLLAKIATALFQHAVGDGDVEAAGLHEFVRDAGSYIRDAEADQHSSMILPEEIENARGAANPSDPRDAAIVRELEEQLGKTRRQQQVREKRLPRSPIGAIGLEDEAQLRQRQRRQRDRDATSPPSPGSLKARPKDRPN